MLQGGMPRVDQVTRKVALGSAAIHGVVHASVMLLPALLGDLQRVFGVGLLELALAGNLMYLAFGIAALPAGYLSDRMGARRMMFLAALGTTVSLFALALAERFFVVFVALVALGLCAGVYHPSGLSFLSRHARVNEQGRTLGLHGAGGNLGEALAPAAAALLAAQLGWRYAFLAAGLCALACCALIWRLPRHFGSRACPAAAPRPTVAGIRATLAALWRSRPLRLLLLSSMASGLIHRGALMYLPLHLSESAGGLHGGALLTTLVLLCGVVAQHLGGELADRLPRVRLLLFESALFAPVLLLVGLGSGAGLVALALGFGFLWYLTQPLVIALCAEHADVRDHGLMFGLQLACTFAVGSFATTLGGFLTVRGGTSLAFLGFFAIALSQLGTALALVRAVRLNPVASPGA